MFKKRSTSPDEMQAAIPPPIERITSVLSSGISCKGELRGAGGVRIEGAFEGDIALRGMLVISESGRVTCRELRANTVIVAGAVRGDITAEKVEIRGSGRVWGNVVTVSLSTEEGAFLRGHIQMEEQVDIGVAASPELERDALSEPESEEISNLEDKLEPIEAGENYTPDEKTFEE
jgi:cytoskeletal protein CcmA (bactofilin family)